MSNQDSTGSGPAYGQTQVLCDAGAGNCPTVTNLGDFITFGVTGLAKHKGLHLSIEDAQKLVFAAKSGQLDWIGGGA